MNLEEALRMRNVVSAKLSRCHAYALIDKVVYRFFIDKNVEGDILVTNAEECPRRKFGQKKRDINFKGEKMPWKESALTKISESVHIYSELSDLLKGRDS